MLEIFKRRFIPAPAQAPLEYLRLASIVPIAQNEKWNTMERRKALAEQQQQQQQPTSLPKNITPFPQSEPPKGA